jgi:hypothetical protein
MSNFLSVPGGEGPKRKKAAHLSGAAFSKTKLI